MTDEKAKENKNEEDKAKNETLIILETSCSCGATLYMESNERLAQYSQKDCYKEFAIKHQICPGMVKNKGNDNENTR